MFGVCRSIIEVGLGRGDSEEKLFKPFSSQILKPIHQEIESTNSAYPVSHCYYLRRGKHKALLGFCTNNYRSIIDGIPTFNLAKVQLNEYCYLNGVRIDTSRKGIATMMMSHKILRFMEMYNDTFCITGTLMDDASKAWYNGQYGEGGEAPKYIYHKIFQHDEPQRLTPNSDWTDKRMFLKENRDIDRKYYQELYEEQVRKIKCLKKMEV